MVLRHPSWEPLSYTIGSRHPRYNILSSYDISIKFRTASQNYISTVHGFILFTILAIVPTTKTKITNNYEKFLALWSFFSTQLYSRRNSGAYYTIKLLSLKLLGRWRKLLLLLEDICYLESACSTKDDVIQRRNLANLKSYNKRP